MPQSPRGTAWLLGCSSSLFIFLFVFVCVCVYTSVYHGGVIAATNISYCVSVCDYACISLHVCFSVCNLIPGFLLLQHLLLSFVAESRSPWVNWLQSHMTEDTTTRCSSVCCNHRLLSNRRKSSDGFIKIVLLYCAVWSDGCGCAVASPTGLRRLTHVQTTSHVCVGSNSPICLVSVLFTCSGTLQGWHLSFLVPASLDCLYLPVYF